MPTGYTNFWQRLTSGEFRTSGGRTGVSENAASSTVAAGGERPWTSDYSHLGVVFTGALNEPPPEPTPRFRLTEAQDFTLPPQVVSAGAPSRPALRRPRARAPAGSALNEPPPEPAPAAPTVRRQTTPLVAIASCPCCGRTSRPRSMEVSATDCVARHIAEKARQGCALHRAVHQMIATNHTAGYNCVACSAVFGSRNEAFLHLERANDAAHAAFKISPGQRPANQERPAVEGQGPPEVRAGLGREAMATAESAASADPARQTVRRRWRSRSVDGRRPRRRASTRLPRWGIGGQY